nr:putative transcriptional regulatory protein [Quercus suber]
MECAGYSSEATLQEQKQTSSDAPSTLQSKHETSLPSARQAVSSSLSHEEEKKDGLGNGELSINLHGNASSPKKSVAHMTSTSGTRTPVQEPLFSGPRNRMPYFRWLGPTAIMPGFKQMVVKVRRQDPDIARSSTDGGLLSPSLSNHNVGEPRTVSAYTNTPTVVDAELRTPLNLPFYDTSPIPPSELITHLAHTFFCHLGCNYPFLQEERFMRDLEEKQVDAILVDAVCALAARFSTHPLLQQQPLDENKVSPAEFGHAFAMRAKAALVDTFPCPSVAAVQAALLLAYNEFGESRDSGLWMYLGISIRMAQDLGMHKLEGLKYKGKNGPTPKMIKRESQTSFTNPEMTSLDKGETEERTSNGQTKKSIEPDDQVNHSTKEIDEQKSVEQERVDTFWAVFFLDRVVSSGTGRRSTLRDKDIELSFPSLDEKDPNSGWPAPFPALIRIVHLYGRVADLLNSIKEPSDITNDTPKRLAAMEHQVTNFYQGLPLKLHFDAVSFQYYMKAGQGTNFVLLHFWFHTLIVLLHQPTLLKTFEGRMLQLFPNSQQLSMSSAKTIADILSYSQLMDAKASLGNPFTSQPIYIAACAFLKETAERTATSNAQSRASSPAAKGSASSGAVPASGTFQKSKISIADVTNNPPVPSATTEQKSLAKHTLLATAASQHYQLCYKALQSLETYWSGTKYILTILDQMFEGVEDPLLYTVEEGESSMERPKPEPMFTSPGWRRKLPWGPYLGTPNLGGALGMQDAFFPPRGLGQKSGSPTVDPNKGMTLNAYAVDTKEANNMIAIGWTLTGTMDSSSTNLAWHFAGNDHGQHSQHTQEARAPPTDNGYANQANGRSDSNQAKPVPSFAQHLRPHSSNSSQAGGMVQNNQSSVPQYISTASTADADLLLGLNSPFNMVNSRNTSVDHNNSDANNTTSYFQSSRPANNGNMTGFRTTSSFPIYAAGANQYTGFMAPGTHGYSDMMIESQDVDMNMLGLGMMPWFDSYPTHEMMGMGNVYEHESNTGMVPQTGRKRAASSEQERGGESDRGT